MVVFKVYIINVNNTGNLSAWAFSSHFVSFRDIYRHWVPACHIMW